MVTNLSSLFSCTPYNFENFIKQCKPKQEKLFQTESTKPLPQTLTVKSVSTIDEVPGETLPFSFKSVEVDEITHKIQVTLSYVGPSHPVVQIYATPTTHDYFHANTNLWVVLKQEADKVETPAHLNDLSFEIDILEGWKGWGDICLYRGNNPDIGVSRPVSYQ